MIRISDQCWRLFATAPLAVHVESRCFARVDVGRHPTAPFHDNLTADVRVSRANNITWARSSPVRRHWARMRDGRFRA